MKSKDDLFAIKRTRTIQLIDPPPPPPSPLPWSSPPPSTMMQRGAFGEGDNSTRSYGSIRSDNGSIRSHGSIRSSTSLSSTFTADNSPKKGCKKPTVPHPSLAAAAYPHPHHLRLQQQHQAGKRLRKHQSCRGGFQQQQQHHHGTQRRSKPRFRVCFNEGLNVWYPSNRHVDDLPYLWFQEQDYMDFHEGMAAAVTAITTVSAEQSSSCETVLNRVFEACLHVDLDGSSKTMTREEKKELRRTFKATPDLLGLERSVSMMLSQDRIDRREALIETMDDLQSYGWPDMETESRKLCEASLRISRTSRLLARHLAVGIAPSGTSTKSASTRSSTSRCHGDGRSRSHSPPSATSD